MKFCKNLQRVVEISDPEWAPYWINYKHLKKLIKGIVSSAAAAAASAAAPPGEVISSSSNVAARRSESEGRILTNRDSQVASNAGIPTDHSPRAQPARPAVAEAAAAESAAVIAAVTHQSQGDETSERRQSGGQHSEDSSTNQHPPRHPDNVLDQLGKSPGERAFFKLLHSEVKKSTQFFEQAQKEYAIREERVRKGLEIIKNDQSDMSDADERWSRCAQSIFRLYRELLLLETFAIMTYCGFSKILKKHDKNTGFSTRNAFMAKIVNQANFVNYPQLLQMINRCEQLYEEVSNRLVQEGKDDLHEDERLFIHMIHRLNAQVTGGDEKQAAGKTQATTTSTAARPIQLPSRTSPLSQQEAWKAHSLKELVAENDDDASTPRGQNDDDSDSDAEDTKPKAIDTSDSKENRKRGPSDGDPPAPSKKR